MSARPSIYVSRKRPAPGGKSPNAHFPQLTTEIRIFAPAVTPSIVLAFELSAAMREAAKKMHGWPGPDATTPEQAESELATYGIVVPPEWRESGWWPPVRLPS
jgi:hypothetical protein